MQPLRISTRTFNSAKISDRLAHYQDSKRLCSTKIIIDDYKTDISTRRIHRILSAKIESD
ncbi:hypothetical protein [Nostoc sp.]|uniref:hypothetical protein n=1 Tax=Nostoc sp. TaxID=1180 RepID=UPI002FF49A0A